ncbi:N-terminal domain of NEFA-interacting nuclear protein NIP30-domain-containing protein [Xylariaceae sp. FL0255]|nr:N-terminal domain of NEFA-interacting nuclear protein NIP30-domain-containing protein [Xylariaceae sp. FL0255]
MTSRFVSGGTIAGDGGVNDVPTPSEEGNSEVQTAQSGSGSGSGSGGGSGSEKRTAQSIEWETVQKELDKERRKRAEARRTAVEGGVAGGERSLYEVLQANKAAKQAAFEEQNRIRNQFRSLDDDEIDFLDTVQDERRAEEDRVKRETEEGLAEFRRAQKGSSGVAGEDPAVGEDAWGATGTGRKRKREKEKGGFKGLRRRVSANEREGEGEKDTIPSKKTQTAAESNKTAAEAPQDVSNGTQLAAATTTSTAENTIDAKPKPKPALGLVDYGSDEDDDDD